MILLPIVARELRVAARRRRTYYARMLIAAAMIGFGGFLWAVASWKPGLSNGFEIFETVSTCLCIWAVISGWASYDCISKEKRDGTIGLLFLTDLKGLALREYGLDSEFLARSLYCH